MFYGVVTGDSDTFPAAASCVHTDSGQLVPVAVHTADTD